MTPAQISCRLARAIGWEYVTPGPTFACVFAPHGFREFDYRDPAVIWRVAERYNCFPVHMSDGKWRAYIPGANQVAATTAAEAVALAVIGARP